MCRIPSFTILQKLQYGLIITSLLLHKMQNQMNCMNWIKQQNNSSYSMTKYILSQFLWKDKISKLIYISQCGHKFPDLWMVTSH